ncbi:MAG: glycosyltransferase family 39 protein, partial [Phycisphaeraceae bacterium]
MPSTTTSPPPAAALRRRGWAARLPFLVQRHRYLFLLLIALLWLPAFNGQWRIGPDSAFYATVARNLVEGRGYTHPLGNASFASPGLPYLLAGNFALFGAESFFATVLLMWLMGVAILALTYHLLRIHGSGRAALAVTLLLAINSVFLAHALEVLTDIPFMLGVMLFLVGYERYEKHVGRPWINWSMILAGGAIMTAFRIIVIIVLAALVITLVYRALRQRRFKLLALAALATAAPLAIRLLFPGAGLTTKEQEIFDRLLHGLPLTLERAWHHNLPNLFTQVTPGALLGSVVSPDLWFIDAAIAVTGLGLGVMLVRRRVLWGVLVILFIVQWVLFLPDVRYFLPILPLLAYAWYRGARQALLVWPARSLGAVVAVVMISLWVGVNVVRCGHFVIEQRRPALLEHYMHGRYWRVDEVGHQLRQAVEPQATILTDVKWSKPITFYSQRRAISPQDFKQFPVGNGPLYVIEPYDELMALLLRKRGWTAGPSVLTVDRSPVASPLHVRRVVRSGPLSLGERAGVRGRPDDKDAQAGLQGNCIWLFRSLSLLRERL